MSRWIFLTTAAALALAATALTGCDKKEETKPEAEKRRVVAPPVDYFSKTVPQKTAAATPNPNKAATAPNAAKPATKTASGPLPSPASPLPEPSLPSSPSQPPKVTSTNHAAPTSPPREGSTSPVQDEANRTARFLGLMAPKSPTWTVVGTSSSMRKAEYSVPGVQGKDAAEIVVFHFGKDDGGTNEANIDRWTNQFRGPGGAKVKPKMEEFTSDGMRIVLVELAGEYQAMQGSFKPDQLFLGAIVEAPVGKVFIRFVGPAATVEANRADFMDMVRNLRRMDASK